jgi:hypothetical protein
VVEAEAVVVGVSPVLVLEVVGRVTPPVVVVAAVVLASSVVLPEPLSLQARGANRVAQIRSDKQ